MQHSKTFVLRKNDGIEQNLKLSQKSKRRLQKSKAENTLKAYESDWIS